MKVSIFTDNGELLSCIEVKKSILIKSKNLDSALSYNAEKFNEIFINISNVDYINILK